MPRQKQFFERQPQYIQDMVLSMAEDCTVPDIIIHLKTLGIDATYSHVGHFKRKHAQSCGRHETLQPDDTHIARIGQYIECIKQHHGNTWRNKNLALFGAAWSRCADKLCAAGLIAQVKDTRPLRYEQIMTDDEMDVWYTTEVM